MVIRDALNFFRQPFARIAAVLAVVLMGFDLFTTIANWAEIWAVQNSFSSVLVYVPFHHFFLSMFAGFVVLFVAIAVEYASRIANDIKYLRSKVSEEKHEAQGE